MDHTDLNLVEMLFVLGLREEKPRPGKFDSNLTLDEFHGIGAALAELMEQEALKLHPDGTVAVISNTKSVPEFGRLFAELNESKFYHGRPLSDLILKLSGPTFRERIFEPTEKVLVRRGIVRVTVERRAKWLFLSRPKYHLLERNLRRALIDEVHTACRTTQAVHWRIAYLVTFLRVANTRSDVLTEDQIEVLVSNHRDRLAALQKGYSRDIAEAAQDAKRRQRRNDEKILSARPNNAGFALD